MSRLALGNDPNALEMSMEQLSIFQNKGAFKEVKAERSRDLESTVE